MIFRGDGGGGECRQKPGAKTYSLTDNLPATCFPTSSALASTWDTELLEEVWIALGEEARAGGVSVLLGPGANIKRTPLCGRNFEYFSEDPLLSSRMAATWIRGVQSTGGAASLKHFAANNQEHRRMVVDVRVDERALREIYLASFEGAVAEGRPWTVMAAYNRLDGEFCAENHLLTEILRGEWDFDGAVMSDWGAVNDRVVGLAAGCDLEMPGYHGYHGHHDAAIVRALAGPRIPPEALDAAARRLLTLVARTSTAREPGHTYDRDAHHTLARRPAVAGTVLLKNDGNLLPLPPGGTLAVIGAFAKEPRFEGAGSSNVTPNRLDDGVTELAALIGDFGRLSYAPGYHRDSGDVDEALLTEARTVARDTDAVVVVVGLPERDETEGVDRVHMRLPAGHDALIEAVLAVNPAMVVVLSNGAPLELPWSDRVPAIVEGYLGGQAGGSAIARVLLGAAGPGGRLTETVRDPRRSVLPGHPGPRGGRGVGRVGRGGDVRHDRPEPGRLRGPVRRPGFPARGVRRPVQPSPPGERPRPARRLHAQHAPRRHGRFGLRAPAARRDAPVRALAPQKRRPAAAGAARRDAGAAFPAHADPGHRRRRPRAHPRGRPARHQRPLPPRGPPTRRRPLRPARRPTPTPSSSPAPPSPARAVTRAVWRDAPVGGLIRLRTTAPRPASYVHPAVAVVS